MHVETTMTGPRIAALVPMRHHSQRVPGKSYRPLAGKPLYYHILETLLAVPGLEEIAVDTDSDLIKTGLRDYFPRVRAIDRPEHLRGDSVPMNDVLLYDTAQVQADFYLQTHATNPLLLPQTVSVAIQVFLSNYPAYDSLFSVTPMQTRLYDQLGHALNHDPAILVQTQDLPPVYEENSCIYLFNRVNLADRHHRIGKHPWMFPMDSAEAWDIDDELDFSVCDFLLRRRAPS